MKNNIGAFLEMDLANKKVESIYIQAATDEETELIRKILKKIFKSNRFAWIRKIF